MTAKYFIDISGHEKSKKIPIISGLDLVGTEYFVLGGLTNWDRKSYHDCLNELLGLYPNSPECDMGFHPLDIKANFQTATVSNGSLGTFVSLSTKELISIIEESLFFRHYVRKEEHSKKIIRKAIHKLFIETPKHLIIFDNKNKVSVADELFVADVYISLTPKDYESSIDDFMDRIDFKSDLR